MASDDKRDKIIAELQGSKTGSLQRSFLCALEAGNRAVIYCPKCMAEVHASLHCPKCGAQAETILSKEKGGK